MIRNFIREFLLIVQQRENWQQLLLAIKLIPQMFKPSSWRESSYSSPYLKAVIRDVKHHWLIICAIIIIGVVVYLFTDEQVAALVVLVTLIPTIIYFFKSDHKTIQTYTFWGQVNRQLEIERNSRLQEAEKNHQTAIAFMQVNQEGIDTYIRDGGTPIDLSPLKPEVHKIVSEIMVDLHRVYHEVEDRMSRGEYL